VIETSSGRIVSLGVHIVNILGRPVRSSRWARWETTASPTSWPGCSTATASTRGCWPASPACRPQPRSCPYGPAASGQRCTLPARPRRWPGRTSTWTWSRPSTSSTSADRPRQRPGASW